MKGGTKSSDEFVICGSKYLALRSQWCFSSVSLEKYKEELQVYLFQIMNAIIQYYKSNIICDIFCKTE